MNEDHLSPFVLPFSESHFYTLRLWEVRDGEEGAQWRARLQHVPSGEVKYFRNLEAMLAFLHAQLNEKRDSLPKED
ncbi:MAG: hypothetical protein RML93_11155 [Anaerolineales bacterium]|nr:hypothetical protein [Anaerolineales bacterium]MCS7248995.1 hypothetical protein [Anaerolineales bacterium]MDW8162808.1 hypothetical protein [Anaerolineales bacterium]MDW8447834.1 hypothetical protein [Anaerolineales bacterium]